VAGVGLTQVLGSLGEQADMEVHPAEVTIAQPGQPGSDLRLDLRTGQPCIESYMHPMLYASCVAGTAETFRQVPEAM
jgi:hypothetical protein